MAKLDAWLEEVFCPVVYYRLDPVISYSDFKKRLLVRKMDSSWYARGLPANTTYSLCYAIGDVNYTGGWIRFSMGASDCISEKDVVLDVDPCRKAHAAFGYSFHANKLGSTNICRLVDLTLPSDCISQIRDSIVGREDDEELKFRSRVILHPKETFEEALIEKDLASRV